MNLGFRDLNKGERRELNPRIPESQPGALTTWLRSPAKRLNRVYHTPCQKLKEETNETKGFFSNRPFQWGLLSTSDLSLVELKKSSFLFFLQAKFACLGTQGKNTKSKPLVFNQARFFGQA
jgi:hypothetical protein